MLIDPTNVGTIVTAIGALGTASFGLVDATKALGGGVSLAGLGDIDAVIKPLYLDAGDANATNPRDLSTPLTYASVMSNLKANWINGTGLSDQKAIAKTLLKLRLHPGNAVPFAGKTGVNPDVLQQISVAINQGLALTTVQADVFGRFDLALTSILDQAYQRADQRYRNTCKVLAGLFSIIIAIIGGWIYTAALPATVPAHAHYANTHSFWFAFIAGALATPLAPIAKDITSAIAAGTNVAQKLSR